jgi:hypothetical protein
MESSNSQKLKETLMNTSRIVNTLVVAAIMALVQIAQAVPPSGDYSINSSGTLDVWDISGTYSEGLGNLDMNYTLNVDNQGKITGAGTAWYRDRWDYLDADFTYTGTVRSAGTVTRVKMTFKMNGSGVIEGQSATFKSTMNLNLEVDPWNQELLGTISGSISVKAGRQSESAKIPRTEFYLELPGGMDGSWQLDLEDLAVTNNKVSGTAVVRLSNGRTIRLQVTGSHSPKTDVSKLALKGLPEENGKGVSLNATTTFSDDHEVSVSKLKGKLLGQTIKR